MGDLRVLFLFAALTASAGAQPSPPVHVTGTVRSAGLPIPGATVIAAQGGHKIATTTDETGRYEFDLPAGTWNIQVDMMAFAPARREVVVGNAPVNVDYALELRPAQGQQQYANRGPGGGPPGQRGFRNLSLNQTAQIDALTEAAQAGAEQQPNGPTPANANEAFLMNGTLDRGLQQAQQQPNLFGDGQAGWNQQNQQNPFGQQGAPGMGGGPGGGFGGGGRGGPGGFGGGGGGRGGWGGPGGPNGPGGRRRPGQNGPFGNRARRGQQGYHGSLSVSLNNSVWDARPFSLTGETVPKPNFAQGRFSFAGGGPFMIPKLVRSPRTFLFFSYFGTRARNPYDGVGTVPTADEREGNFSALTSQLYYPGTGMPIPGNIIPSLSPVAQRLLSLIPLPNQPGFVRNYQYTTSTGNNADNFGVRANHNLSQNDRFDGNFNAQHRNGTGAQLFGYTDATNGAGITTSIGWTHNFSPTTLNHVIGSFSRNSSQTTPFFAFGTDLTSGIGNVSPPPADYGPPTLSFTNFSSLSDANAVRTVNQTTGVSDTLTLIRGTHSITAGGGYRRVQINQTTDQNARGTFTFTGLETSLLGSDGQPVPNTGNDFADFLLGFPYDSSVSSNRSDYFRAYAANAFVSDDWHLRDNLTITVGLRYEFFSPYSEKYNRLANLAVPAYFSGQPTEIEAGQPGVSSGLINPAKDLFSPRAGLAWKPWKDRSTLVRLGYGIFYNGSVYAQFPAQLAAQPPFITNLSLLNSTSAPVPLQTILTTASPSQVTNTYAVDPNYRPGYAQTWNVSVQQNLPRAFIVDLEYLGTKGTRLDTEVQPYFSGIQAAGARVASYIYDESDGNSIYHALQARLIRRFAHGISMNGLYTFSKSIDDASTIGGGMAVVAQNPFDLSAERGLSSFDKRNTLNLTFILASPVGGPNAPLHSYPWAERALKDWTLSGGVTFSSGLPLTAQLLGNQSDVTGTGAVGSSRAEATGLPIEVAGYPFFNPLAFTTPPPGELGNASRNTIPGPDQLAFNLSLARSIDFGERRRLEFRVDTTNFTNSVYFTSYGTVVNATNYGLATAAAPMRALTLTTRFRF
ncbi:MAG: TonB-dependent receptor [Bryobacteraceae bacterium]